MKETILVTGCAGFIGYHVCNKLLNEGHHIVGIDNISDYYDVNLKQKRISNLQNKFGTNFTMVYDDICEDWIDDVFDLFAPSIVIHLAAQAGVRYSLENPDEYIRTNINGFYNILKLSQEYKVKKFIYASSSSVYGESARLSFDENMKTDYPESLYAATKKCDEILAEYFSNMFDISCTGLRFFTVYGEWGRPDMFYYDILNKWKKGEKIQIFNNGNNFRQFTYIKDAVQRICKLIDYPFAEHCIFNIASESEEVKIDDFVKLMFDICKEEHLLSEDVKFEDIVEYTERSKGDVCRTKASTDKFKSHFGSCKTTILEEGLRNFVNWYKEYEI